MRWISDEFTYYADPWFASIEKLQTPDTDGDHALVCHSTQSAIAVGTYEELVRARGWRDEEGLQLIEEAEECAEQAVRSLIGD